MAGDELEVVRLRNDFYRDGFYKVLIALTMIVVAITLLVATSVYIYTQKPPPVTFLTDNDWRAFPPVPVNLSYPKTADLLQWVSEVLPDTFRYDFENYAKELEEAKQYFTDNGWSKMMAQLDTYANANVIQSSKLFLNANASAAPVILNQGIIDGRYGWWIQLPIVIHYSSVEKHYDTPLVFQVLVTRVSTLEDLTGIAIDNVVLVKKEIGGRNQKNG